MQVENPSKENRNYRHGDVEWKRSILYVFLSISHSQNSNDNLGLGHGYIYFFIIIYLSIGSSVKNV